MSNISRRSFLQKGTAAAAALTIVPSAVLGKTHGHIAPTDKLNIAGVGIGGMGNANLKNMETTENIVALCDIDWKYSKPVFDRHPQAKKYCSTNSPRLKNTGTIVRCMMRWVNLLTLCW